MNKINKILKPVKVILIILLFPIVICWIISKKIKLKQRKKEDCVDIYNISQIDDLSGIEFENLLKSIFESQGYMVSLTKKSHDYGADLILKKKGKISVVQAKCYGKNIGIKAIQEIISAKKHYGADEMFVATNRYFSKDAVVLASEHDVRLIDRGVLTKLIRVYSPNIELSEKRFIATNQEEKQKILKKYRFWI